MLSSGTVAAAVVEELLSAFGVAEGAGEEATEMIFQFPLLSGVSAQVDGPLRSTTTGHHPSATVFTNSETSRPPHRRHLCSAVIVTRALSVLGHNAISEKEEGAAVSFGGNGLGIGPGVGIRAIDGVGPGFGFFSQEQINPPKVTAAELTRKVRRCMLKSIL